jgi:L-fucose/D-arabinose isomerase
VHHPAAEVDFTFARPTRREYRYRMHGIHGPFLRYDEETNEDLMCRSTYVWPHALARMDEILSRYGPNHIYAGPGDYGKVPPRSPRQGRVCVKLDALNLALVAL